MLAAAVGVGLGGRRFVLFLSREKFGWRPNTPVSRLRLLLPAHVHNVLYRVPGNDSCHADQLISRWSAWVPATLTRDAVDSACRWLGAHQSQQHTNTSVPFLLSGLTVSPYKGEIDPFQSAMYAGG